MLIREMLAECPLIAILRGIVPEEIPDICDALYVGGIRVLEIPLNSPRPLESIAAAVKHVAGRQAVGAGTVLTPDDVADVHGAGGQFIVSPNTDEAVIRKTVDLGIVSIPGFFTATEAFVAMRAGAHYLKLFPAGDAGATYVRDLKAVVTKPILAVGGVNQKNLPGFMKYCAGAGIGSALYKPGKTPAEVEQAAREMVHALKKGLQD